MQARVNAEDIRTINELKDALNRVAILANQLFKSANIRVQFNYKSSDAGELSLDKFDVMAPLDVSKFSS